MLEKQTRERDPRYLPRGNDIRQARLVHASPEQHNLFLSWMAAQELCNAVINESGADGHPAALQPSPLLPSCCRFFTLDPLLQMLRAFAFRALTLLVIDQAGRQAG